MVFGNPNAETFMYWGFWEGATSSLQSGSIMVHSNWKNPDGSWNLTPAGQRYEWLFGLSNDPTKGGANSNPWKTDLMTTVAADGTIDFTGFYGDYEITVNGQTFDLTLGKGDTSYSLAIRPGDYNADGRVDAADYIVWRQTAGSTTDLRADGNGDEVVDQSDYDVWRSLFGTIYSSGAGVSAVVPEPSGAMFTVIVAAVTAFVGRRRQIRGPEN
jgi:hypothetical protein